MSTAFQHPETSIPELKRSCRCLTKHMRDMFEGNEQLDYKWQTATIEAGATSASGLLSGLQSIGGGAKSDLHENAHPFHIKEIFLRDNNK